MNFAELGYFVERGAVDFFLGVEAGAHGPFVEKMKEGAGFDQADGFRVGQNVESDFGRNAPIEKLIFCGPGFGHGAVVEVAGARIIFEKHGRDVVRLSRVGQCEERARTGDHAVALVLTVRGVADFFCKSVIGVLERAHGGRVDADVESLQPIKIARRVEQAIDGFGVATLRFGLADYGAIGFGHYTRRVGRIVDQPGSFSL